MGQREKRKDKAMTRLEALEKVAQAEDGLDMDEMAEDWSQNMPWFGATDEEIARESFVKGWRSARASQGSSVTAEHKDPTVLVQALKVYGSIYNWRVASQKNSERAGFEFMADDQAGYLAREALRQWESQK